MKFKIKKGNHYSNKFLYKLFNFFHYSDHLSYFCKFNKSALYIDTTENRFDINKLFGFSIGRHHINSYRFGWNVLDGVIHIYAYSYIDSVRRFEEICTIDIDKEYKFIVKLKNGYALFTIIDDSFHIKQALHPYKQKNSLGYCLWPYFGGNNRAPQSITIELIKPSVD